MKSPVGKFRPELERTMQAARDQLADTTFASVTVKSELSKAAAAGRSVCVLLVPLDLRATGAAKTIETWCRKEGLRTTWSHRPPADAHGEAAYDLVVSWGPDITGNA